MYKIFGYSFYVVGAFALVTYSFDFFDTDGIDLRDLAYLSSSLLPVLIGIYLVSFYRWGSSQSKIFTLITVALLGTFIGEMLWVIFDSVLGIDPFPSSADIFYIAFYPLVAVGLIMQLRSAKVSYKPNKFADLLFIVLGVILTAIIFYFDVVVAFDSEVSLFENAVAMFYGIADLVLIILCFFILKVAAEYEGGKMFYSWIFFFLGIFALLIADILFAIFGEEYETGEWVYFEVIDMLWIAHFLLLGYSLYMMIQVFFKIKEKLHLSR